MNHEQMPPGTALAMRAAAELLRSHEDYFRDLAGGLDETRGAGMAAVKRARMDEADNTAEVARQLEQLLDACPHAPPGVRNPIFERRG